MNRSSSQQPSLEDILKPILLKYAIHITFPWPLGKPLDASEVGRIFFGDHDATRDWDVAEVKNALTRLANIGTSNVDPDGFVAFVCERKEGESVVDVWERVLGVVLVLDQGGRYLCKGVNGRYVYQFFDVLTLLVINTLVAEDGDILNLTAWENCGIHQGHAILRMLMLLAPLVHSKDLKDQEMQLRLTERMREDYEKHTGTLDPYHQLFERDSQDIYLIDYLLTNGPPRGDGARMPDFAYWMMRYYTSHVAYVRRFGRSPFRNVAVGEG